MKILIINYYFDPIANAHSYRWNQLSKIFSKSGIEVDVISSKVHGEENLSKKEKVEVKRVGVLKASKLQDASASDISAAEKKKALVSAIKVLKYFYRKVFWPDGLWHWLVPSILEIFRRRLCSYDLVISYAPTLSAHLTALALRKVSKHKFVWIAEYGDPFSTSDTMPPNNLRLYQWLNIYAERTLFKNSDYVCFTNFETKLAYEKIFGINQKFIVIPHTVNVEDFYSFDHSNAVSAAKDPIRVVYVGGLHKGIREPFSAIRIFIDMREKFGLNLTVDFYGPVNEVPIASLELPPWIRFHGAVGRAEAIALMKSADILMNIENMNCVMTPSKIAEYVSTGIPVVNICVGGVKSYLFERMEKVGFCYTIEGIDNERLQHLAQFIVEKSRKNISLKEVRAIVGENEISQVANNYLKLLNSEKKGKKC